MMPSLIKEGLLPLYRMSQAKEASGSKVVQITKKNFQEEILESKVPIILDASASECIPCTVVASIFSKLSQKLQGRVKFAKFDTDTEKDLSNKFNIRATPTLLFFKDAQIIGRHEGALSKKEILAVLNTLFSDLKLD